MKILLVDDHTLLREGLAALLAKEPDLQVVGQASDGREALALARELHPDVVVMDIGMPGMNGFEATRHLLAERGDVKVVALSMSSDRRYVLAMFDAGASGYLLKSAAAEELVRAVHAVSRDQVYVSPEVAGVLVDRAREASPPSSLALLSPREREVLQLIAEGMTSKEIAQALGVAVATVETHRRQLMDKLKVRSVAALTKLAVREGLTTLER